MAFSGVARSKTVQSIDDNTRSELRTLTPAEISAKQLQLDTVPTDDSKVVMDIQGAPSQFSGPDFVVTGDILSWEFKTLETLLEAGELIRIQYVI